MFVEQRLKIDPTEGLRAGSLVLTDSRSPEWRENSYTEGELEPVTAAWNYLQAYIDSFRENVLLCHNDCSVEDDYNREFELWLGSNAGGTTTQFDRVYEPTLSDADVDPRLGSISYIVSEVSDGSLLGIFHLYNIRVELDSEDLLVITAFASPSITTVRGFNRAQDVGLIMRHLLLTDVAFADSSRELDLISWNFPTTTTHKWAGGSKAAEIAQTLRLVTDIGKGDRSDVTVDGEPAPQSIRRKAGATL